MTNIPTTAKRFANWLKRQKNLPPALRKSSEDAQVAHDLIAQNRTSKDLPAIKKIFQPRIDKFWTEFAAWKESLERS